MKSLSFRISEQLARQVAERAGRWPARSDSDTYRQVIEEWVRLQDHPGIRFVDGPAGRRAALVGGPDIWEIIDMARELGFDEAVILDAYPWLTADNLRIARRYFDAYPDEIEALIEDNLQVAEQLEHELDLVVRERAGDGSSGDRDRRRS
ncbi:MAG: hypothetical protein PVJ49_10115 [Acidobacteriota bacterium]|jgi:hypothetical protein